jgi:hypothetical protein
MSLTSDKTLLPVQSERAQGETAQPEPCRELDVVGSNFVGYKNQQIPFLNFLIYHIFFFFYQILFFSILKHQYLSVFLNLGYDQK